MVEGNGAARELFDQGYRYLFAVLNTSDYYLRAAVQSLAEQAKAQGKKPSDMKIAIAIENDPFSQDVRDGVVEDAKKLGMKIVIDEKLPPELNDMSATLTKVKALRPDMLAVSGHAKGATLAASQVSQQKVDVPMLALTHCDSARIVENLGHAAEYAVCASQWDSSLAYSDKWFGSASDYAERFKKEFGYEPPYQAAESTAAALVYADAIARAGSLDTEKIRDAIAATDMTTFYGPVKFDETGKNVAKSMVLYQVQGGDYRVVAPERWAESKLIFPTPPWSELGAAVSAAPTGASGSTGSGEAGSSESSSGK
jgi:branched-chain amino acid transport system substrate-binding protein